MFGDGVDSNANMALSAALRANSYKLPRCSEALCGVGAGVQLYLLHWLIYLRKIVFLDVRYHNTYRNARN